ncbi:MAG: ABC transporter substrate-binding protein [Chloroflexota bacterium]
MTLFRGQTRRALLGTSAAGAVLAACAPGGSQAPVAQSTGPVTIEVLTRSGVASPTGHSQFYDKRAKGVFTPETKITVNFVDATPDVGEKLTIMASGGTLPDASWFGVVADGNAGREQATKGIFKPIDDLIKKDSKFDIKPYFKAMLDGFTVTGKLYALPTHAHYGTNVLYYNKNMTRAAGVNVPEDGNWTIDEFVVAAQKLVRKDQDIWGYFSPWGFSEFGVFYVRQFGGEYMDESGKRVLLDSAEARAGIEWIYNAQAKHATIDKHYRDDTKASNTLFVEGKLGFVNWTPGFVAEWNNPGPNQISTANGKFDLGVALFPKGPNGRRGTQASGSGMGITGTKNQAAAWEYVKFVTNKVNGVEQVFGGAGSPGGRTDVWTDPKLLSFNPIYSNIVKAFPQGAGSLRYSANFRYAPLTTAVNKELEAYFRNQTGLADATSKAVQAGNAELNR